MRQPSQVPVKFRGILFSGFAVLIAGCADPVAVSDRRACTNVTSQELAELKKAVQTAVASSSDLTAYQAFVTANGEAIEQSKTTESNSYYHWEAGQWKSLSTTPTTGVTSFIFSDGASLVVQSVEGEGIGHLEGAGFSYYIRAKAPTGFPSGDIRLLSLGEWSAVKRAPAEYFGTGLYSLRFPGGEWEEKEELDLGDQYLRLTVAFSLPHFEVKLVKRTAQVEEGMPEGDEGTDSLEIMVNGTPRCAGSEDALKSAFPDVWGLLQLK